MELQPDVTVSELLSAIPSAMLALDNAGITGEGNEGKSLQQVCEDRGIAFEEFLRCMDEIDWSGESPGNRSGES